MESIDVFSSLHSNMSACGVMMKTEGSMLLFPLCSIKTLYQASHLDYANCNFLIILDYRCNNDATAMIYYILYCVLSVIQGIAFNTGILPFSKGRVLKSSQTNLSAFFSSLYKGVAFSPRRLI